MLRFIPQDLADLKGTTLPIVLRLPRSLAEEREDGEFLSES
jgi:hypothetical protein